MSEVSERVQGVKWVWMDAVLCGMALVGAEWSWVEAAVIVAGCSTCVVSKQRRWQCAGEVR